LALLRGARAVAAAAAARRGGRAAVVVVVAGERVRDEPLGRLKPADET